MAAKEWRVTTRLTEKEIWVVEQRSELMDVTISWALRDAVRIAREVGLGDVGPIPTAGIEPADSVLPFSMKLWLRRESDRVCAPVSDIIRHCIPLARAVWLAEYHIRSVQIEAIRRDPKLCVALG